MDLSVIILSYNSKEDLKRLLPSVFGSFGVGFVARPFMGNEKADKSARYTVEVIIVDNGSSDGTLQYLKTKDYKLKTMVNSNTGFAAGNNIGIKQSSGKYILLLNPDTKLEADTLQTMFEFMETHSHAGISTCKVLLPNGKLDLACRRRFPNPWNSFKRLFLLSNRDYNFTNVDENQEMEVDAVMGAFLLIKKSVIDRIGLLDEDFFMYGEDLDWCWRAKEAGYQVWYHPAVSIIHFKGSSSRQVSFRALKWFSNAMWIFYKKHYSNHYSIVFDFIVWFGIYSRMSVIMAINIFRREKFVSR